MRAPNSQRRGWRGRVMSSMHQPRGWNAYRRQQQDVIDRQPPEVRAVWRRRGIGTKESRRAR